MLLYIVAPKVADVMNKNKNGPMIEPCGTPRKKEAVNKVL